MKHSGAFRILVLFITVGPLTQYLGPYHSNPHLPAWQEDPLFNTLLAIGFYLGINGLWEAYNILNRQYSPLKELKE